MGILTGDDSLVDAALSEVLSLSLPERLEKDPDGEVDYLLSRHYISQVGPQAQVWAFQLVSTGFHRKICLEHSP